MEIKRACIGIDCKGAGEGAGRAVFITLNAIDSDQDVTLPGAVGSQVAKFVGAHAWEKPNIGAVKCSEKGSEVLADFQFYLEMASAKEWYFSLRGNYEFGVPQELSYGFDILDSERGTFQGKSVRFLKKLRIIEVSPVMKGAGVGTRVLELKHCTNCGAIESPRIAPQAHSCSCGAKANGHANGNGNGDALLMAALKGVRDPLQRAQVRVRHWELMSETGRRLAPLNGHGGR